MFRIVRCPHCQRLLETEGLPTEEAPLATDNSAIPVMSEDETIRIKLEKFCIQMELTRVQQRELAGELKPYPKAAILSALDIWHTRQCLASGKSFRYFIGIVRGESNTMASNTKKSGGLPPLKE